MRLKNPYAAAARFEHEQGVKFRTGRLITEPRPGRIGTVSLEFGVSGTVYPHPGVTEKVRIFEAGRRSQASEQRFHARMQRFAGHMARKVPRLQQYHGPAGARASDGGGGPGGASADHEYIRIQG
jgi:hypothetical protein